MTPREIESLGQRLHDIYGERFPLLTAAKAAIWLEDLRADDAEMVDKAILRWYRQHQQWQAPTLQNLLDTLELVEDDARAIQAALRPPTASSQEDVLRQAAALAPATLASWAHCHVQMVLEGLGRPSNYLATAARCRECAVRFPTQARHWEQAAQWWEQQYHMKGATDVSSP